jgi:6-phosphogluconolactonase
MPEVQIYPDLESVAQHAAQEFIDKLELLSSSGKPLNIMLTGGTVGIRMLERVSEHPKLRSLSLNHLNLWWGDERFVPNQHPDRNALQARGALIDSLDLKAEQIHEFPAADSGLNLDQAAEEFAVHYSGLSPSFDLVLLGVGPDGHIASLFPGNNVSNSKEDVIAEPSSPKPPSARLSFNYSVLNSATEVWFLAAGIEKSEVVAEVLRENSVSNLPAAKVSGRVRTVWFLDEASASLRE